MIKVSHIIRDKWKIKVVQTQFCLGIGLDQFTPDYYEVKFEISKGAVPRVEEPITSKRISKKVNNGKNI